MSMVVFDLGGTRFNYRVGAVCLRGEHVMLHRAEDDPFWALPGGRVNAGETARDAVQREVREELDEETEIGRLLWVVENFFTYHGLEFHSLELVFEVTLPADSRWQDTEATYSAVERDALGREVRLVFRWFPLAQLDSVHLRPSFLNTGLLDLPATTQHLVHVGR